MNILLIKLGINEIESAIVCMRFCKMASMSPNVIFVTIFLSGCLLSSSSELISPRIYGGHSAVREEVPYIVSIENRNQQLCAGSILNQQWIVTVAHCVANETSLRVYAGLVHSKSKYDGDVQVAMVLRVVVHPKYDYSLDTIDNDVALLLLATNLTFNDVVQPIEIMNGDELAEAIHNRRSGIISGWGHSENYFRSKVLRTAEVLLLSNEECLDDIPFDCHTFNPVAHLCSGPLTGPPKGVGLHDDGGPLVVNNKLAGIILHGEHEDSDENCHLSSIYARVWYYRDFLREYLIFPEPTTEPTSDLGPCLLEIEISFELLNGISNNSSSFVSGSYLFNYSLWFFGNKNIESNNSKQTTETYEGTFNNRNYSDVSNKSENIENGQLEEDIEQLLVNPEKLILNIQVWTSSQNVEKGIGFRLFPNSPVDSFILIHARTE